MLTRMLRGAGKVRPSSAGRRTGAAIGLLVSSALFKRFGVMALFFGAISTGIMYSAVQLIFAVHSSRKN